MNNVDYQNIADQLFERLTTNQIDRLQYCDGLDQLWDLMDPASRRSLGRRKDNRTLGQFGMQIYDNTMREKFLLLSWLDFMGKKVSVWPNGVANDGRIIIEPRGGGRADFVLINKEQDQWYLEVKFDPTPNKFTFKIRDLKAYLDEGAHILLFITDSRMIGPNGKVSNNVHKLKLPAPLYWCWMTPYDIENMMRSRKSNCFGEVGNKNAIQFNKEKFEQIFKLNLWRVNEFNSIPGNRR